VAEELEDARRRPNATFERKPPPALPRSSR